MRIVDCIKTIDVWVGIPLCFVLQCIHRICKIFAPAIASTEKKRFLFIEFAEMGAIICALPLMQKVRLSYPQADIYFLTFLKNKPFLSIIQDINQEHILYVDNSSPRYFIRDVFRVVTSMRKLQIDTVFDLEFFSRFSAVMTYMTGASRRIGFSRYSYEGLYRGNLLTHAIPYNPFLHISQMYLMFADALIDDIVTIPFARIIPMPEQVEASLSIPQSAYARIDALLRNFFDATAGKLFVVHQGDDVLPQREWPNGNYIALAQKILSHSNHYIVLIGARASRKKAEVLMQTICAERCVNLTTELSLPEIVALFQRADFFIAPDCGLSHLAALTAIKQCVFFGPETPHIFRPLGIAVNDVYAALPCSPCVSGMNHRTSRCVNNRCMYAITPDTVYNAIMTQCSV